MTSLRRYVDEHVDRDPGFARALEESDAELELAVQLTRLRESRGWTQRQLAERAGMKQSAVARYEKAGRTPSVVTLWRLATALDATIMLGPNFSMTVTRCGSTDGDTDQPTTSDRRSALQPTHKGNRLKHAPAYPP